MAFNPILFYEYGVSEGTFVSRWNTNNLSTGSSGATQVKLPLESTGTYNFIVDWGDGGPKENITAWNAAATTHTYTASGTYTISIKGLIKGFSFGSIANAASSDKLKILSISKWGPLRLGNNGGYFSGCQNITLDTITDKLNLAGTTTLTSMFYDCRLITTIGRMDEWDLSNVTNLSSMFEMYVTSGSNGIGNFDQNIGAWDVSKVTSFAGIFRFSAKFDNGGSDSIGNWNVSSATDMNAMFSRTNVFNRSLSNWERSTPGNTSTLSKVINMLNMFNAAHIFNQPIGNWNVSNVTNMQFMFYQSIFNQDIGSWNISKVANFASFGLAGNGRTPFSPTTLDLIYNGWSTRTVIPNCNITFGVKFTSAGLNGRNILTGAPNNWTITDGTAISGTSNNGGLIRITTSQNHGWTTGTQVYVFGVGGTTNANGTWTITFISANVIELQGSSYNAVWTSGGNVILP